MFKLISLEKLLISAVKIADESLRKVLLIVISPTKSLLKLHLCEVDLEPPIRLHISSYEGTENIRCEMTSKVSVS